LKIFSTNLAHAFYGLGRKERRTQRARLKGSDSAGTVAIELSEYAATNNGRAARKIAD